MSPRLRRLGRIKLGNGPYETHVEWAGQTLPVSAVEIATSASDARGPMVTLRVPLALFDLVQVAL